MWNGIRPEVQNWPNAKGKQDITMRQAWLKFYMCLLCRIFHLFPFVKSQDVRAWMIDALAVLFAEEVINE